MKQGIWFFRLFSFLHLFTLLFNWYVGFFHLKNTVLCQSVGLFFFSVLMFYFHDDGNFFCYNMKQHSINSQKIVKYIYSIYYVWLFLATTQTDIDYMDADDKNSTFSVCRCEFLFYFIITFWNRDVCLIVVEYIW